MQGPYETYQGSPVSQGILQYDMWGVVPSPRWNWAGLKESIATHGVRNSLLLAPMPTASTSQVHLWRALMLSCCSPLLSSPQHS